MLYYQRIRELDYEMIAHCTCEKGVDYAYDGRNCKDRKTKYFVPSVADVFGVAGNPFEDKFSNVSVEEAMEMTKAMVDKMAI